MNAHKTQMQLRNVPMELLLLSLVGVLCTQMVYVHITHLLHHKIKCTNVIGQNCVT